MLCGVDQALAGSNGGTMGIKTGFFVISSDTAGEARAISEAEFDALTRDPQAWELFAAIKGDFVWAHGGAVDDHARKHRRGERLYAANIVPLIQLARTRRWLTPSQVHQLRPPTAISAPRENMDGEERYRKALEKGRRAVDVTIGKQGKLGIWRTIETGPRAGNGERRYRFKAHPTHPDGRPVRYCLAWAEDVPDGLVFEPSGPGAEKLPLCDGAWGLVQFRASGVKVTVRDVVWSGLYDELVVLADLRNESEQPVVIEQVSLALAGGKTPESKVPGPRVRAAGADVVRVATRAPDGRPPPSLVAGGVAHYVSWAWNLLPVLGQIEKAPVRTVDLSLVFRGRPPATVKLPFRVSGEPVKGLLVRNSAGWLLKTGWRQKLHDKGFGKIARLLQQRKE